MKAPLIAAGAIGLAVVATAPLLAGPERVAFPAGFETAFVHYNSVDRPDRKRVRLMYVSPESDKAARPDEPAPDGTVLVMADKSAKVDAEGNPILDADGRMIPEGDFTSIFVMEKRAGWGAGQPADMKNGDWDYASYRPDGTLNPEAKYQGCFSCHNNRAGADFTFTYFPNVAARAN